MAKLTGWDFKAQKATPPVEISPANVAKAAPAHWPLPDEKHHEGTEVITADKPPKTLRLAEDYSTFNQTMAEAHGADWNKKPAAGVPAAFRAKFTPPGVIQ